MNGENGFMVLNNKLKGVKNDLGIVSDSLDIIESGISEVSDRLDGIESILNDDTQASADLSTVNSTIGTDYFVSLDKMISARIVLVGWVGTTFTFTESDYYKITLSATLTEDDTVMDNGLSKKVIAIPVGDYSVHIVVDDIEIDTTISIAELGKTYFLPYKSTFTTLATYSSADTYTFENGETQKLVVTATGAGGGGGSGVASCSNSGLCIRGGAGGGAGDYVINKIYNIAPNSNLTVVIGTGGAGGAYCYKGGNRVSGGQAGNDGQAGTPTIFGSFLTLSGGTGGQGGHTGSLQTGESVGGTLNGGNSGDCVHYEQDSSASIAAGAAGGGGNGGAAGTTTHDGSYYAGGAGGGGGSPAVVAVSGKGGDGGVFNTKINGTTNATGTSDGGNGTRGAGGGGGGWGKANYTTSSSLRYGISGAGGNGGDGYVIIYKGVVITEEDNV